MTIETTQPRFLVRLSGDKLGRKRIVELRNHDRAWLQSYPSLAVWQLLGQTFLGGR